MYTCVKKNLSFKCLLFGAPLCQGRPKAQGLEMWFVVRNSCEASYACDMHRKRMLLCSSVPALGRGPCVVSLSCLMSVTACWNKQRFKNWRINVFWMSWRSCKTLCSEIPGRCILCIAHNLAKQKGQKGQKGAQLQGRLLSTRTAVSLRILRCLRRQL